MKKLIHFLTEHALALLIAAIAAVSVILIIIIFTLASSGSSDRKLSIKDISGSAFILRSDGQIPADKNTVLESGDVIITSSDGEVKLVADKDKYIYIEPDTTLYVNFTDVSEKGSVIVNISEGSAICRLDSKLPKNAAFEVRTPNAVISATGTVFRTDFSYLDTYGGHDAVKLTDVDCAEGTVDIQLYDDNASPADQLMLLAAGKSARLMTCADSSRFEYLNSDTDLYSLSESTLRTYIRISADRPLAYPSADLNNAYQYVMGISSDEAPTQTILPEASATEIPVISETELSLANVISDINVISDVSETDTSTETSPISESSDTTTTSSVTTVSTAISVAEATTKIFSITSASAQTTTPAVTTASSAPETVTTPPPQTTVAQTTATVPVIKPAEPVTTPSETSAPVTEPPVSETTVTTTTPVSTIPWWEIINSAALTS
ncbi:MAG: FecR domain-containing protein [Oscillospiraceae bacterium]|nr:FecR family protein [Oscillospiraceae bacterium]MDD7278718.1 FecR domain-containing protein [Oscillospiraceae bacterium]MDY2863588.1 FecR domain-containing protein [Oscillospiraceae bacterium]